MNKTMSFAVIRKLDTSLSLIGFRNILIIAVTFTGIVIFIPGGSIVSKCDPCIIHVGNWWFY